MTERQEHPTASHGAFPYYFDGTPTTSTGVLTFPYSFPFAFQVVIPTFPYSFPFSFAGTGGGTVMTPHWGFNFVDIVVVIPPEVASKFKYDLAIFYGDLQNTYIDCRCSQWDTSDYSVTIGTWVKKDDLYNLKNNIRPGAVKEFKRVIYAPKYYDSTWQGYNTIRLYPTPSSQEMNDSTLKQMRKNTIMYVKTITEHPINNEWIEIKLEGNISGSTL